MNRQTAGALEGDAPPARKVDREDLEHVVSGPGGENDLSPVLRPREAFFAPVPVGERDLLSGEIHDSDAAAVVELEGMLEERDPLPVGREPDVGKVSARLEQDFSERVLESVLAAHASRDGELRSVGRPVGFADISRQLARRPALERHPGERSEEHLVAEKAGVRQHGKLAARGHGQKVNSLQPAETATGESGRHEKTSGTFPVGAALKTTVFPSGANRALKIGWCLNVSCRKEISSVRPLRGAAAGEIRANGDENRGSQRRKNGDAPLRGASAARRQGRPWRRDAGEGLEIEGEVARGVEALLGILLEAVADDALEARAGRSGS